MRSHTALGLRVEAHVKRILGWFAAFMLVGSIATASSMPAAADHDYDGIVPTANYNPVCYSTTIGSPYSSVCLTDNRGTTWYADKVDPGELETDDFNALQSMLESQFEPTVLTITYDSTPDFAGGSETDLVYQEAEAAMPLPSGAVGIMWCDDAVNSAIYDCDQAYMRIQSPDWFRKFGSSVACHETGHGVGLVHGYDASPRLAPGDSRLGCMENADEFPSSLGASSRHLINGEY